MRIIIITLFFLSSSIAEEIEGMPKIIDGDTIHIENFKIRFEGIDAPEMKQKFEKKYIKLSAIIGFTFYKDYYCGKVSKTKLIDKIGSSKIKCIFSTKDRYNRYIATCFKDKINLNQWMVRNGYAIAYRRYSNRYVLDEEFAENNKLGLWQGRFLNPEKWRKLN